jgi:hypothetical protein
MPALATKLVTKFAGPTGTATLTITTKGAYNALNGNQAADSESSSTPDVSPPVPVNQKQVSDNSRVLMGDMVVWIDSARVTLTRDMINNVTITYAGQTYDMIHYNDYMSGANSAAYEVFLRDV